MKNLILLILRNIVHQNQFSFIYVNTILNKLIFTVMNSIEGIVKTENSSQVPLFVCITKSSDKKQKNS